MISKIEYNYGIKWRNGLEAINPITLFIYVESPTVVTFHLQLQLITKLGSTKNRSDDDAAVCFDAVRSTFDLLLEYIDR